MFDFHPLLVIGIGALGSASNSLMLFALVQSRSQIGGTPLVINQMRLDLVCSVILMLVYASKYPVVDYTQPWGPFLCRVVRNEAVLWAFIDCSIANLVLLTVERYLKIVHPLFHRTNLRSNTYRVVTVCVWFNVVAVVSFVVGVTTSAVVDGRCAGYRNWKSVGLLDAFAIWYFLVTLVLPLIVFVYCYSRILHVIRSRKKVTTGQ